MSMLAEKKRKQKWLLNPQGKHWLSESNKFGLKVLESLGWKEGNGLGKQQDGIKEPIKISYKNDNKGFGLKETHSSLQQDHFNNLLESLNKSTDDAAPTPVISLEEKSQNSRKRVHYKKFTRGKDLSRYSEKDLASIFEKKTPADAVAEKSDNTVNMGSMKAYFKNKLSNFKLERDYESETEQCNGFGFKTSENGITNRAFEPLGHNLAITKHALDTITEQDEDAPVVDKTHKVNPDFEVKRKSKKKKHKRGNITDDSFEKRKKSKLVAVVEDNSINENFGKVKKRKKGIDNPALQINRSPVDCKDVNHSGKVKKRKGIDNPALQLNDSVENSTSQNVKKRKGIDNPSLQLDDSIESKDVAEGTGIDNPALQFNYSVENSTSQKVKKRKGIDNPSLQLDDSMESKDVAEATGIDNPALNVSTPESTELDVKCDLMLNVVTEPVKEMKPQRTKKMKNSGCYNYGFDVKAQKMEENITSLTKTIDSYQAEVENDINESKDVALIDDDFIIGEYNNGDGENEKHKDGVLLRYKYASFGKDPYWAMRYNQSVNFAKKSYKHLIKGDIAVAFKESNLHEIKGYGLGTKL